MGDADGTNLAPLTAEGLYFSNLHWSPDGRWLLTAWQPDATGLPGALYLLSSDGTEGRLLTNEQSAPAQIWPVGWSPDGQQAIYLSWPATSSSSSPEILSAHVETREKHPLPGLPDWSPDGSQLVYATGPVPNLWLADAGWDNARPIADRATIMWQGESWSPDGSRLAFTRISDDTTPSAIAIYDLALERITPLITPSALTSALLSYQGDFISDGTDLAYLKENSLRWLWPWGWSADGRQLLVWAYTSTQGPSRDDQSVLAAVTLQDVQVASVQVLAYGTGRLLGGATWSPTAPRRLALKWWSPETRLDSTGPPPESPSTFLVDLDDGVLFSASSQSDTTPVWSPDGDWVAFVAQQEVTVVDRSGKNRFSFAPKGEPPCSTVAWNPAADLGHLGQTSESGVPARKEPELIVSVGHVEDFPPGSITPLQLQATINDPQRTLNQLQTPVPAGPATVSPVPIFLVHDPEQGFRALYNRDTWLGCRMTWVPENQRFESPCHGQYYSKTGECVRGPCPRGLDRFAVVLTKGGEVLVDVGLFQTGPPQDSPIDQDG
jgi:Tol biopolymer transport system component/nitrite reductase/ring-hydroxylating ferredoxin subunit